MYKALDDSQIATLFSSPKTPFFSTIPFYRRTWNRPPQGHRPSAVEQSNQASARSAHSHGQASTLVEFTVDQGGQILVSSDEHHFGCPGRKVHIHPNVRSSNLQQRVVAARKQQAAGPAPLMPQTYSHQVLPAS